MLSFKELTHHDDCYALFNRYSCNLAKEYSQNIIDNWQAELASQQTCEANININFEDFEEINSKFVRIRIALEIFDPNLLKELDSESFDNKYTPIVNRLIFGIKYIPTWDDYKQALLAKLTLRGGMEFLDDIVSHLKENHQYQNGAGNSEFIELTQLAYVEAISIASPNVKYLEDILINHNKLIKDIESMKLEGMLKGLFNSLSPMARQAYFSAETMLNSSIERDNKWEDAGMISLGFFRILELEINDKIFIPLRDSSAHCNFLNDLNELINEFSISRSDGNFKSRDDKAKFWVRMYAQLEKFFNKKVSGLELGAIQLLLAKTKSLEGSDAKIKLFIFNVISSMLNDRGIKAYKAGELDRITSEENRNRYRNPPAHSRYLNLTTAIECKRYVEASLFQLVEWVKS